MEGHPFRDAPALRPLSRTRIAPTPRAGGLFTAIAIFVIWEVMGAIMLIANSESILMIAGMVLFMAFGLLCLAYAIHEALALLNPVVELHVSEPEPAIGETLEFQWQVKGRASRIAKLSIELTGTEQCSYTRGTDTTHLEEVFFREQIVVTDRPAAIAGGTSQLTIPAASAPTFAARHNQVVWRIAIKGEIARWPDIEDSFELRVVGDARARKAAA